MIYMVNVPRLISLNSLNEKYEKELEEQYYKCRKIICCSHDFYEYVEDVSAAIEGIRDNFISVFKRYHPIYYNVIYTLKLFGLGCVSCNNSEIGYFFVDSSVGDNATFINMSNQEFLKDFGYYMIKCVVGDLKIKGVTI